MREMEHVKFIVEVAEILTLVSNFFNQFEEGTDSSYGPGDYAALITDFIENGYDWEPEAVESAMEVLTK